VIALILQANPTLNWREIQHILVLTANPYTTKSSTSAVYTFNGGGFGHSYGVGFGIVDAQAAVAMAITGIAIGPELTATCMLLFILLTRSHLLLLACLLSLSSFVNNMI
jgi:hypothetical protein